MKPLLIFLFMILFQSCLGQDDRFCGNWLSCGYWGMSYCKIKKSEKVTMYTSNCKDRGTKHHGTWTSSGDTITLTFKKTQSRFILKEGKLCNFDEDGNHGEVKYGISRTRRVTTTGAIHRCRKERKRKRKRS